MYITVIKWILLLLSRFVSAGAENSRSSPVSFSFALFLKSEFKGSAAFGASGCQ